MAVGPVGQRPLANPAAIGQVQPLVERSGIQAVHSQLSQASGASDRCAKIPVLGWIVSGIISCYSWFVKFALSCCTRAPNPPAPSVNERPNEAIAVNPRPSQYPVPANPGPNPEQNRSRPIRQNPSLPVESPAARVRPAQAPAPAVPAAQVRPVQAPAPAAPAAQVRQEENLAEELQDFMIELPDMRRRDGNPLRLPLEPVPENRFEGPIPIRLPAVGGTSIFAEALLSVFLEERAENQAPRANAREFADKAIEVAAKLKQIENIRRQEQGGRRDLQPVLQQERIAVSALFQELRALNTNLNDRVGNQLGVIIHRGREDVAQGGPGGLDVSANEVLVACLSDEDARNADALTKRAAKAVVLAERAILINNQAEQIRVNLRSLSKVLENARIRELISARANLEGISTEDLLQRMALQEGVANFERASIEDKARISRIAALNGANPDVLRALPDIFSNAQAMRLISQIADQLSTAPAILRNKLREQIRAEGNRDLIGPELDFKARLELAIGSGDFARNARQQERQVIAEIPLLHVELQRNQNREQFMQRQRLLDLRLAASRQDQEVHLPRLTAFNNNEEAKIFLTQVFFLARKVDERDRQIAEHQAGRLRVANVEAINEARVNNDDGISLHKGLLRVRLVQLQGEERASFFQDLINGEAGRDFLKQQARMAVAAIMVDGSDEIPHYMEQNRVQLEQLHNDFNALNQAKKNQVIAKLYAEDGQMPESEEAQAVWRRLRGLSFGLLENHGFKESVRAAILNFNIWFKVKLREDAPSFAVVNEADQKVLYTYLFTNQTLSQNIGEIYNGLLPELGRLRADRANTPLFDDSIRGRRMLELTLNARSAAFNNLNSISKAFILNYCIAEAGVDFLTRVAAARTALQDCRRVITDAEDA